MYRARLRGTRVPETIVALPADEHVSKLPCFRQEVLVARIVITASPPRRKVGADLAARIIRVIVGTKLLVGITSSTSHHISNDSRSFVYRVAVGEAIPNINGPGQNQID